MSGKSLVIVESPTKAKTITKFLGKDYIVKASNGHIRDLPNSAAEIPIEVKKEPWSQLGVNVNDNFQPLYVIPENKKEHVKKLREALKDASVLFLATDEDREGESISWHIVETLKPKIPIKRLVFHEITKEAIAEAIKSTRDLDQNLVRAQETRRIIDRLFGYEVSPLLWKKIVPRLSAGRVQSVAVRLLVDRERERIKFHQAIFWGLKAQFSKKDSPNYKGQFDAELISVGDKRVAIGKDFDPQTGLLINQDKVLLLSKQAAEELRDRILKENAIISSIEEKPFTSKPAPPFVTSTLQQEGNRKLRFSAKRTMSIAQQLYENGFITYMRTDSTTLSQQALAAARNLIQRDFGNEYLPSEPRHYATKVKNAQEAHEAIRPAGEEFTKPEVVEKALGTDAFKLYELIWKRTVGSQMKDAYGTHTTVQIKAGDAIFRTTGKTIQFAGFLRAYVEGSDDPDAELADQEKILPPLKKEETINTNSVEALERSTQSPARYTEGSLIKELEKLGIGRPSTWATIVDLVLSRSYAFKRGNALVPTFTAFAVVGLLENNFPQLLNYEFTAKLEDDLDGISRGEGLNLDYLKSFYFGNGHPGLKPLVEKGEKTIDPREVCKIALGKSLDGDEVEVRIGRHGPFISNGEIKTSVPETLAPDELTADIAKQLLVDSNKTPEALGVDPQTGLAIFLKVGPYGPYVQLGENTEDGKKPKMASLLKNTTPQEVTLEYAIKLLSLPKSLGEHPELKKPIIVSNGRFGPYIKCGEETRSIPLTEYSPLELTLDQAIALLKEPKRARRGEAKSLRELGPHPINGLNLIIKSGTYGPYVTDGKLNASLPKGTEPENLSMEDAVNLLEARATRIANDEGKPKRGKKQKTSTKKTTTRKSTKKSVESPADIAS